MRAERHREARVERAYLLDDARVARARQPGAAVALRDEHPEEAEILQAAQHLVGDAMLAIDLRRVHVRLEEAPHAVEQGVQRVGLLRARLRPREDRALVDHAEEEALHERLLT